MLRPLPLVTQELRVDLRREHMKMHVLLLGPHPRLNVLAPRPLRPLALAPGLVPRRLLPKVVERIGVLRLERRRFVLRALARDATAVALRNTYE